jgi:hypothetical protein
MEGFRPRSLLPLQASDADSIRPVAAVPVQRERILDRHCEEELVECSLSPENSHAFISFLTNLFTELWLGCRSVHSTWNPCVRALTKIISKDL